MYYGGKVISLLTVRLFYQQWQQLISPYTYSYSFMERIPLINHQLDGSFDLWWHQFTSLL